MTRTQLFKTIVYLTLATLVIACPRIAGAVPPPKTEEEMMEMADLVVDATCVAIMCEGPPVEDSEKITTTYLSTLFPSFSYMGGLPNSLQIRGFMYDWKGDIPVGGWHQGPVPEGFSGKFFLERLNDGTYSKVWWNGIIEDQESSDPKELPSCEEELPDGGVVDGGPGDGSPGDGSSPDGWVVDGDLPDGGVVDGGSPDGGSDANTSDRGCSCRTGGGRPSPLPLCVVLVLAGFLALAGWRRKGGRTS